MLKITCGADPEFWLTQHGEVVPCVGRLPGTKDSPYYVPDSEIGLTLQEDGVAVEIGFDPVALDNFVSRANIAMEEAHTVIQNRVQSGSYYVTPSYNFTDEQLSSDQANSFGCSPDNTAYGPIPGAKRPPLKRELFGRMRCAAGHVHVGYDKTATPIPEYAVVRFMDLGYLWTIYRGEDRQGKRRNFYGMAGLYRPKPYGLEYRTPSNAWLHEPTRVTPWFQAASAAINKPGKAREMKDKIDWAIVQQSITSERMLMPESQLFDLWDELMDAPDEGLESKVA